MASGAVLKNLGKKNSRTRPRGNGATGPPSVAFYSRVPWQPYSEIKATMDTHSKGLTDANLQALNLKRGFYGSFRKVPVWTSAASGLCPGNAAERPGATGL